MKRLGLVLSICLFAAPALAGEKKTHRPGYEASPKVAERYKALESAAKIPLAKDEVVAKDTRGPDAIGELVSVEDGIIRIRVKVTAQQIAVLRAAGAHARDFTDGWYHQSFDAVPDLDLKHLEGRTGRTVRLALVPTDLGRRVVISANFVR